MAADKFVLPDGTEYGLGNIDIGFAAPAGDYEVYGSMPNTKKVERADWFATDFSHYCSPIKDQGQTGACNLFTTVEAVEGTRRMQGLDDVLLSPGWAYGQLSPDPPKAGTYLEEAIQWAMDKGFPPTSVVAELDYRSRPPAAVSAAKPYRALKAAWCKSAELVVSALLQARFVNIGLMWFAEDNPGPDGWLSENPQRQVGGHSVTGCGVVIEGGRVGIKIANHYTRRWGQNGFGILPYKRLERDRGVGGMWSLWGTLDSGNVLPPAT